ncbi:hypothetical protein [Sphingobium chungbukense]|uniref:hypothetical protein n=1 Tax=Sphingobium chungbukense TaxID=56193 RepID=UPI000A65B0AB|nr:hypothetical protein [Sphingobium chungbukense]
MNTAIANLSVERDMMRGAEQDLASALSRSSPGDRIAAMQSIYEKSSGQDREALIVAMIARLALHAQSSTEG